MKNIGLEEIRARETPRTPIKSWTIAELRERLVETLAIVPRTLNARDYIKALRWRIRAKEQKLSPSSTRRRHRGVSAHAD